MKQDILYIFKYYSISNHLKILNSKCHIDFDIDFNDNIDYILGPISSIEGKLYTQRDLTPNQYLYYNLYRAFKLYSLL